MGRFVCLLALTACAPQTTAMPPQPAAPSTLVRGDEGLNALVADACGMPCEDPLPDFARELQVSATGVRFVQLEPARCRVPSFGPEPQECVATCSDAGVVGMTVDFGPIGPSTRSELCLALQRDRGEPARGSCDDICEEGMGCAWPSSADRVALEFVGHVQLSCGFEPNHSDASNSMSP